MLRRSRDLVDLVDLSHKGPTPEPHPEQTRSRLVGRKLQSRFSNSQPSSSRAVEQRGVNKVNAAHEKESASPEAAIQSPRQVKHDIDKPLPPPPRTVIISSTLNLTPTPAPAPAPTLTPTPVPALKPTLRSRFNTGPASGQASEIEIPRVVFVPHHVDPDLSITAVLSPPREKTTHYRPATGDLWPFLDMATSPSRKPQRASSGKVKDHHQQQEDDEEEPTTSRGRGEQKVLTQDRRGEVESENKGQQEEAIEERPSDYELFVQQAREKDRHYREQLLRVFSRHGARDGDSSAQKKKKQRDPDRPRVFSWQRAAAKRQQEEEGGGDGGGGGVRRSWGAGETVQSHQNPSGKKRHSDIGPSNSGGGLRRKGSMSSLSSIGKALANYIKPPKSPNVR